MIGCYSKKGGVSLGTDDGMVLRKGVSLGKYVGLLLNKEISLGTYDGLLLKEGVSLRNATQRRSFTLHR